MCNIKSLENSAYEVNIKFLLQSMDRISKEEEKLHSKKVVTIMNQLYTFMISSGSISPIYMNLFIKLNGMVSLRRFQDYCIVNKDNMGKNDYDEIRYLLSFLVLNIYKHYKASEGFDNNTNPFANFTESKIVR